MWKIGLPFGSDSSPERTSEVKAKCTKRGQIV